MTATVILSALMGVLAGSAATYGLFMVFRLLPNALTHLKDGVLVMDRQYHIVAMNTKLETFLQVNGDVYRGKSYNELLREYSVNEAALTSPDDPHFEIMHNGLILEPVISPIKGAWGHELGFVVIFKDVTRRSQTEMTLGSRLRHLTTMRSAYDELSATLNVEAVLMLALDSALRLSGGHAGYIALIDGDGTLQPKELIGAYNLVKLRQVFAEESGIFGRVWANRKAERVLDVQRDPDYQMLLPSTQAMMLIPLLNREYERVGLLVLETPYPSRFSEDVFELLLLLSNRIAVAIDNASLYKQIESQLEELRASHKRISDLEEMKSEMIRIAAHDLNNPIAAIMLQLDMVERLIPPSDARVERSLERLRSSTEQIQRIVEDILSLERIEQMLHSTPDTMPQTDLGEVVSKTTATLADYADSKSINLVTSTEIGAPVTVCGDAVQIHEAITNLVQNAIKYTPNNGRVEVCLEIDDQWGVFKVIDTGYGVPEDLQPHLFQPFYRAKTRETRHIEGTGLGLHLVKRIVERYRGEIIFASVHHQGSTFGFRLPRV